MRRLGILLFIVLMLAGGLFSFEVSKYYYPGEDSSSVETIQLYTDGGTSYSLVKINGVETFLLANNELVEDAASIAAVMKEYSTRELLPNEEEWNSIRDKFLSFNDSRNYLYRGNMPAEQMCMQTIGLVTLPCSTYDTCYQTANVICSLYGAGSGCYPDVLAQPILSYSEAVKQMNDNMDAEMSLWENLGPENAVSTFTQMIEKIAPLKSASESMSSNPLRFPEIGESCPDCIGVCPPIKLDVASLDSVKLDLEKLKERALPLESTSTKASQIAQATLERKAYLEGEQLAEVWQPKWDAFKKKYESLKKESADASAYVSDAKFKSAYETFSSRWDEMETRLSSRDFEGIESAYASVTSSARVLKSEIEGILGPHDEAIAAQDTASDLLVKARWRVDKTDVASVTAYNSLASKKNSIDAKFKPPKTDEEYAEITKEYSKLSSDIQNFIESQGDVGDALSSFGESFGAASVNGAFTLASAITPLSYQTRAEVAPFIPPLVLLLTDLAIVSVAIVLFVGVLIKFRPLFRNRTVLGIWVLSLFSIIFLVAIGSVSVFAFVNSSVDSGTFEEFLPVVASADVSYVAIDQEGAGQAEVAAMSSCAKEIGKQVSSLFNHSVESYTYSGDVCVWTSGEEQTTMKMPECQDKALGGPTFVLHYSKEKADPTFSLIYSKRADLYGDIPYYERCEIADVLG